MRRYYLVVEFREHHLTPQGQGGRGLIRFQASNAMELYRDLEKDPGTLVAVTAERAMEYPWSEVRSAVVLPPPAIPATAAKKG